MNATLAFCILALTSFSVSPFLLIVPPRNVNEYVSSIGSNFKVIGLLFFVLGFIQLAPRCPLDLISSVFRSHFHDPVHGEQE